MVIQGPGGRREKAGPGARGRVPGARSQEPGGIQKKIIQKMFVCFEWFEWFEWSFKHTNSQRFFESFKTFKKFKKTLNGFYSNIQTYKDFLNVLESGQ